MGGGINRQRMEMMSGHACVEVLCCECEDLVDSAGGESEEVSL